MKSAFECLAAAIDMVMCSVDRLLHFALVRFPALTFFFFTFFVFACADALLGGVPKLWDYYVAGLKAKNDLALSIFAPPLVWAKAHAAFAPSQPIFIPGNYV